MFVRAKRTVIGGKAYEYLQICESRREDGRVRQRVIATLGRRDEIVADGSLDSLLQSMARFSERLRVVEKVRTEGLQAHRTKLWGPPLVFGRLWQDQGLPEILHRLVYGRKFEFDGERVVFAMALQRLCCPGHGSDLQGSTWVKTVQCPGFDDIALQHYYRTAGGFLAGSREKLELDLFMRDRSLFDQELDFVFIDTTSTFAWLDEETELRKRGYSRDRHPECPQVMICLAVDRRGWPIAWDLLPGNTADKVSFVAMIERLRHRFQVRRVVVVADRGMISRDTIQLLTQHKEAPFDYILGCKMRKQKEVSEDVLSRAGRYHKVADNLEVKEVFVAGRRYVVCLNRIEARKDAEAREAILAKLEAMLAEHGPKSVVGNKGFARFVKVAKGGITVNRDAVEADARLDGKFVLRTSTDFSPAEVALHYKGLWRVERAFRESKSTLEVRPVFHKRDDTTIGHIVACFLALRLEVDLQRRLDEREVEMSWPDLMRDLAQVQAVDVTLDDQRYLLRTDLAGSSYHAFAAAGVRPPGAITKVATT